MFMPTTSTAVHTASSSQAVARGSRPAPATHPLTGPIEMMGAPMSFGRNGEIYGEGEPADFVYKVISGTVRTYKVLADGRRQIGAFYLPGDVFGLEVGEEHSFSAEAIAATKVLVVKRSALMNLASRDSDVARELWTLTGRELGPRPGAHPAAGQDRAGAGGRLPVRDGGAPPGGRHWSSCRCRARTSPTISG